METLPIRMEAGVPESWSPQQVLDQVRRIQDVMKVAMKEGEHFGIIPGTKKPSLLKPGAEKLCLTFRFGPEYEVLPSSRFDDAFIIYDIRCKLIHIPTGTLVGTGLGSCNSREEKYRWRTSARKCPECGAEAIIKGKEEYGGGFVCFKKKGGCNAKYATDDPRITEQSEGKTINDNPWDQANTIEKMGCKRALVAAVLNATAASDIFTQDLEDSTAAEAHESRPTTTTPSTGRQEVPNAPTAPATPPPAPSQADDNPAIVTIANVTVRTGKTGEKAWERYSIVTEVGVIYSTFDKKLAERAKEAKGYEVALSWERSGKYLNCTGFEPTEHGPMVVEPEGADLAQGWEPGMDA